MVDNADVKKNLHAFGCCLCFTLQNIHEDLSGLVVSKFGITDCHRCVGSSPISDNAECLSQYDPGS